MNELKRPDYGELEQRVLALTAISSKLSTPLIVSRQRSRRQKSLDFGKLFGPEVKNVLGDR